MTTLRQAVFPTERQALYERGHYSPAIRSNGFLFISGQVGSREDGSPEPDLEQQIRLAFENLNTVLAAAGCSFAHVLDVTLFLVNPEANLETLWKVLPDYWGDAPYPALTGVGVLAVGFSVVNQGGGTTARTSLIRKLLSPLSIG
ncbi:putative translation initiation inhibitor, yjgF family protein [Alcaligenes sp. HPC1271]|nr:putative translation initiation inhibitor, yjgF family protein [Alcaligenes sp. HPC1271]